MAILIQFVLRLSFGLAAGMAVTSPRKVTSGYYRNHLYVLLGLNVLVALAGLQGRGWGSFWLPVGAAVLAYFGAVCWLYEKSLPGRIALVLIAIADLLAAQLAGSEIPIPRFNTVSPPPAAVLALLKILDPLTGGLVLGLTMAAMFLGHWYLNSPSMELVPLKRLIYLDIAAVVLRGAVCAMGLAIWIAAGPLESSTPWFLALRWLAGIAGPLLLAWMVLRTLDVPNTQSATGILYVMVITTFIGELCSELLSRGALFPL